MTNATSVDVDVQLGEISRQVGALAEQVAVLSERTAYLTEQAQRAAVRQQEWDELKEDLTPIAGDIYALSVEQLSEVEAYVQLEDVMRLSKRLARNTRNIEAVLDQFESAYDFLDDAMPLTHAVFAKAVARLDEMERLGYFGFAQESLGVLDNVVEEFSEEDVRQLGDNIVLILNTVKAMTQPEIMNLVNNITLTYQEVEQAPQELDTSIRGLARQMRDPEVRYGLALTLRLFKAVAQSYEAPSTSEGAGNGAVPRADAS